MRLECALWRQNKEDFTRFLAIVVVFSRNLACAMKRFCEFGCGEKKNPLASVFIEVCVFCFLDEFVFEKGKSGSVDHH